MIFSSILISLIFLVETDSAPIFLKVYNKFDVKNIWTKLLKIYSLA